MFTTTATIIVIASLLTMALIALSARACVALGGSAGDSLRIFAAVALVVYAAVIEPGTALALPLLVACPKVDSLDDIRRRFARLQALLPGGETLDLDSLWESVEDLLHSYVDGDLAEVVIYLLEAYDADLVEWSLGDDADCCERSDLEDAIAPLVRTLSALAKERYDYAQRAFGEHYETMWEGEKDISTALDGDESDRLRDEVESAYALYHLFEVWTRSL